MTEGYGRCDQSDIGDPSQPSQSTRCDRSDHSAPLYEREQISTLGWSSLTALSGATV